MHPAASVCRRTALPRWRYEAMTTHVGIVGVGQTHHARRRTDVSQAGLVREAVDRALNDAKLTIDDIDSIVVATGPVLFAAVNQPEKWVVDAIGGSLKPVVRVTSGGGTGLVGALAAYYQIAGGLADRVLVVGYDKLSEGALQYSISTLYDPFWGREFAVGIMGFSAAYWRARMDLLGHTEEAAAMVAVKNRRNAMRNPYALVKKEVTVEEVLSSKPLAWPIKLLDVPPISDGAAAIVLSSERMAAKSTDRPAWIRGMGYFCEADNAPSRSMLLSEPLAIAARRIYRAAGITNPRRQFDVVEVQEPYTCFELSYYESLGLCAPGQAAALISSGATQLDGDIPVNPSGGCAGANRIGAAGLVRVIEAAAQVMGKAAGNQIRGAKLALAQSGGGWANLRGIAVLSA